jgi:peptide/nickel transport system substrate-binding protein
MRSRIAAIVCCAALLLMGAARAEAKDDLVIGISQFPSGMNPYLVPELVKGYIEAFTSRPITAFDKDWKNTCLLCTELPTMDNGLVKIEDLSGGGKGMAVTIKLRPGLKWADGVPLTAHDIAFTARVGRDPNSGFADIRLWGRVKSVDVVDDLTAVMHLDEVTSLFDRIHQILPEHIEGPVYDKAATPGDYINGTIYNRAPTTPGLWNGPWMVSDYRSGQMVVLTQNPYWNGKKPYFKRIVIRDIENTAALQANLLSGDIDMTPGESIGLTIDQVIDLQRQQPDRFNYIFKPSLTFDEIAVQLDNPILADKRVRQALLLSIDRKTMDDKLFGGTLPIAATWVNPLEPTYTPDTATYNYDPARAKRLLADAGWTPGPDGICRNAAGQRLSFTFAVSSGIRLRELQQTVFQSQWKANCIEAITKNEPFRTLFGETMKHRSFTGLVMYSWISGVGDPPRQTMASDHIPTAANNWAGSNFPGFSNPTFDADVQKVETELDPAKRKIIFAEMQRIAADELPMLPLYFRADAHAVPKWLKGYEPTGHGEVGALWAENWHAE